MTDVNMDSMKKRLLELRELMRQKQTRLNQLDQEKNQLTVDIIGLTGAIAELSKIVEATVQPAQPTA